MSFAKAYGPHALLITSAIFVNEVGLCLYPREALVVHVSSVGDRDIGHPTAPTIQLISSVLCCTRLLVLLVYTDEGLPTPLLSLATIAGL
ncbi:hypothetical protein Acr_10g0000250 [Actinidia rufa]|uniref:Uncharacterized protein n=1 Tax=Actinidia rufa TaxID=165716 RepID=A0A7J0F7G2_9ERIC|nr:hypothetical protein Acr_10g0000250 [Actinidia rufa]